MILLRSASCLLVFAGLSLLCGCQAETIEVPTPAVSNALDPPTADPPDAEQPMELPAEYVEMRKRMQVIFDRRIDKLPPEDQKLARAQQLCPIMLKPLGEMGVPIKVDVNGQPVFICCAGCSEELLAHPEKSLARLKAAQDDLKSKE